MAATSIGSACSVHAASLRRPIGTLRADSRRGCGTSGEMELAIFAAAIEQGVAARFEDRFQHAPDKDDMIAARMHRLARAFDAAQRPVQDGRAEFADFPWRRGITIPTLAGQAVRRSEERRVGKEGVSARK